MSQFEVRQMATGTFSADAAGRDPFASGFVNDTLLDVAGVSPSILGTKVVGDRVQSAQQSSPAATTDDITTDFGFDSTAGVDPENDDLGKCVLLEAVGGVEFNTTTGKVGVNALSRSSMVPICDANGDAIIDGGNRVWGVITTPARDTVSTYTLRFFSGTFGSGSETAYTMSQPYVAKIPEKFTLDTLPKFSDITVVFLDDAAAGLTPNSVTDTELSNSIEAYGPTIEANRARFAGDLGWVNGCAMVANAGLTIDVASGDIYHEDGSYDAYAGDTGFAAGVAQGPTMSQAFIVAINAAGSLVRRDGSAVVHPAEPLPPALTAGDIPLLLTTVINGGGSFNETIDYRPTSPDTGQNNYERFSGNASDTQFTLLRRPSRNYVSNEYMLDVFYNGQRITQVSGTPSTASEFRVIDDPILSPGGMVIEFGAAPASGTENIVVRSEGGVSGS